MYKIIKIFCLFLFLFSLFESYAIEVLSHKMTTIDGLANNSIRYMCQDDKGFIWMATLNGLSRYDGNTFTNYRPDPSSEISLSDHRVKELGEDSNGFLWMTTSADLISCLDLKHNCFVDFTGCGEYKKHYRNFEIFKESVWLWGGKNGCRRILYAEGKFHSESFSVGNSCLESNNIKFITEVGNKLWIGTEKGIYCYTDGKLNVVDKTISCWNILSYGEHCVLVSTDGRIYTLNTESILEIGTLEPERTVMKGAFRVKNKFYISTSKNTYQIDMNTMIVGTVVNEYNIPNASVINDELGDNWLFDHSGNLYYINSKTGEIKTFRVMSYGRLGYIDMERYNIVHDSRGIIWIATYGNGLFAYDKKENVLQHFVSKGGDSSPISSNYLQCVFEDRSGSIWVSSEYAGISKLNILNEGVTRIYPEPYMKEDRSNTIRMFAPSSDGNVWVGTRTGGLYLYSSRLDEKKKSSRYDINIYSLCECNDGTLWKATRGNGLWVGDKHYKHDESDNSSLSSNNTFCMIKDNKNRMWVGTFGGGLNMAVPTGNYGYSFKHFFQETNMQKEVRSLYEDQNGYIWVGTSGGIFVFNPDELIENSNSYIHYSQENGDLKSNDIRMITSDKSGNIWIAESGYGFCSAVIGKSYDKIEFTHYSTDNGLINSMVQAIKEDGNGLVWISTEYGLSCFNPDTYTFKNFIFSDDVLGNVYSENCAFRLEDGRVAFGSGQGIVVVDSESIILDDSPLKVTFTDLKINGVSIRPNDNNSVLDVSLPYEDKIELDYNNNSVVIEFSTFDSDTKLSKFIYKLDGYDTEWSVPSSLNFVSYKNLHPGIYNLRVKASNTVGLWGNESVMQIVVNPPFYKTIFAYVIYLVISLVVAYLIFRVISKMNSLHNKIAIEEQLIEYKLKFFTNISHEFRTPLTLIQGAMERIYKVKNLPPEIISSVKVMDKSTHRMLRLINQLLEFRKMQNNRLHLSLVETDVVAFLKEIFLIFRDVANSKNMKYEFTPSVPSYIMYVDKGNLDKVVYNLLSNAFKYTPVNGKVELNVEIDKEAEKLFIKVIDTGVGIPSDKRDKLFERFMHSNFSSTSMGVGLNLTYELVNVHKGTISYDENPVGGSIFKVTLSTDKSVYSKDDFLLPDNVILVEEEEAERKHSHIMNIGHNAVKSMDETEKKGLPLNDKRILIVEDDNDIREFLKEELSPYFEVVAEADGLSGLERAKLYDADLIISDVMMPGIDGFELTKRLKNDFSTSHIPIILLTALDSSEKHLEGIVSGADAYITKPFSSNLLRSRVFKLLEQRDRLKEKFSKDPHLQRPTICVTNEDKQFSEKLSEIFDRNISNPDFSVDEFASLMGLGRTMFYRKVKGVIGYSPNEYMRIVRMKKAVELLSEGKYTVSEITYKIGMNDPFYFSKCFKAQFGVPPSEYVKKKE